MRMTIAVSLALCLSAVTAPAGVLPTSALSYQGAFRVHDDFSWSVGGMAFYPPGDGGNGSLVIFGHAWYNNLGEVKTDAVLLKKSDGYTSADLNFATVVTSPPGSNPPDTPGYGGAGLEYVASTDKLYYSRSEHPGYCDAPGGSNPQGPYWFGLDGRRMGQFVCEVPSTWVGYQGEGLDPDQFLLTGSGWDEYGNGVTLAAYDGDSPDLNGYVPATYLAAYDPAHPMNNWDRDDQWEAGAWLEAGEDSAVAVGGVKDTTNMGADPDAPDTKRAWLMFYDPGQLSDVVHGAANVYDPQPAATLDIQDLMFNGDVLKGMAYDRANNRLYAFEGSSASYGYGDIVHVWVVGGPPERIPGDVHAEGDPGYGCVDGADYTIWADNYNTTGNPPYSQGGWSAGNFTEDDTVDGADYTIWADHYLEGCGAEAVPEPGTLILALGGLAAVVRRRR